MQHLPNMESIRVAQLTLQETGTYNEMFSRPYVTHMDNYTLENITNRVEQLHINNDNRSHINGAGLAGLAINMASPSAAPMGNIMIPQGWSEKRVRFVLEVHCTSRIQGNTVYYFQGYTSHYGISQGGYIDPTMSFIINSFTGVRRTEVVTPNGISSIDSIIETAHVVNGEIQVTYNDPQQKFLMRPFDIFAGMQSNFIKGGYSYIGQDVSLHDTRSMVKREPSRSSRSNNIPSAYVANILDQYIIANNTLDSHTGDNNVLTTASNKTYERTLVENQFIRAITNIKGIGTGTVFTYDDLCRIDNNTPNVTNAITVGRVQKIEPYGVGTLGNSIHHTGDTAYWNSADRETVIATILANAVPALMLDNMMWRLAFRTSNFDASGRFSSIVTDGRGFTNLDLGPFMEVFKSRLENEVLFDLTYGNQFSIMIDAQVNLHGESIYWISLDGQCSIAYSVPSFCDSLIAPVVTDNSKNLYNLVSDFDILVNSVAEATYTPHMKTGEFL